MSGIIGQRVSLGQGNGPDVELIVSGTVEYAIYETLDGFPAIYDGDLGLFCYATVRNGRYESTKTPITGDPPDGVERHAKESDETRAARIDERRRAMNQRTQERT
jgi:hypothetical protein